MTKHDRLMHALAEIKEICAKHEDAELGCGNKCPFLLGKEGDDYRGCEVFSYTLQGTGEPIDAPQEWGT